MTFYPHRLDHPLAGEICFLWPLLPLIRFRSFSFRRTNNQPLR